MHFSSCVTVNPVAHAEDEVTEIPFNHVSSDNDTVPFDFGNEFLTAEAILCWMLQEYPVEPTVQGMARDFLEEEAPPGLEYATDLRYCSLPVWYVMDDPRVKDRIKRFIFGLDRRYVTNCQRQTVWPIGGESLTRLIDQVWIYVK